ncbi:MAG TPA: transposase [Micromonosporaceae bacterium]|nr:transposase [Micromonosporaceae bacterium]
MGRVVIGMDPHKRSATIEVIDAHEKVLARSRYGTDTDGYQSMLAAGRRFPDRVWAVQGCAGIGRHIAQRLVADGETVLDVPAKLSARVRVFDTGQGRKSDPVDAHSVAVAGLRSPGLRQVLVDDATVALRLWADRRAELGRAAPRSSTASTSCCSSSFLAAPRSSSAAARPAICCGPRRRRWGSWPRPAISWLVSSSRS